MALTIAGSDSSGGAGIQADLAVFNSWGIFGTSAITAITAQNSLGIESILLLPPQAVSEQIQAVLGDMPIQVIKIGMLGNAEIVAAVLRTLASFPELPLVVDPVLTAKGNEQLITEEGFELLSKELLPRAKVITPNIPEAEVLLGFKIRTNDDEKKAVYELHRRTKAAIVLKGGHRTRDKRDLFYCGNSFDYLPDEGVVVGKSPHGTGCAFSAAIAAGLATGKSVESAVRFAKEYLNMVLRHPMQFGNGYPFIIPFLELEQKAERGDVLDALGSVFAQLRHVPRIARIVPEVGMNIAYCQSFADNYQDVAGFPGRIFICDDELTTPIGPRFGGSQHTARVVLAAHRIYPSIRCAMPIKYNLQTLELFRRMGLAVGFFDRGDEPESEIEGGTLEWGTTFALVQAAQPLDAIYDMGSVGKEPIIRLLGETPQDLIQVVLALLELID